MIRLLVLVACLFLTACASNDRLPNKGKITVTGVGRTVEEAKSDGFRKAVEIVIGSVIVADTQARDSKLVRDDLAKHSSGYVDDFTIINRTDSKNSVTLVMDVKVRHSAIAERVMNIQAGNGEVNGQRLDGMYTSFMQSRKTGDQLLLTVLNDYPKHAFNVEGGPVQYMLNINRLPVIVIPYKITWNYKYLTALNEALDQTKSPKDRYIKQEQVHVISKSPTSWILGSTETYYFNDELRSDMIRKSLGKMIFIQTVLKDRNGKILKLGCDAGRTMASVYPNGAFVINGNIVIEEEAERTIKVNQSVMAEIASVEVTVESTPCTFIN